MIQKDMAVTYKILHKHRIYLSSPKLTMQLTMEPSPKLTMYLAKNKSQQIQKNEITPVS